MFELTDKELRMVAGACESCEGSHGGGENNENGGGGESEYRR